MNRRDIWKLATAGVAAPSLLHAQEVWPTKPIQLVVPWPTGGGPDIVARSFQSELSERLRQPVMVVNRPGAVGSVGAMEVARAAADGYTWMLAFDSEAPNQATMRLPYRLMQAFAPVSTVATAPLVLITAPDTPWKTLQELVNMAKRTPDTISYTSPGTGSLGHVSMTLLQQMGGFTLNHVPYRVGAPVIQAVLTGEIPLFITPALVANPHIRSGKVRALAVSTESETRHVPGIKSFAEQGFGGFEAPTWWAFLGRAGTPEPILRKMSEALTATLTNPDVRAKIEGLGADVVASGPERARRFLNAEVERWGRVVRENNIAVPS